MIVIKYGGHVLESAAENDRIVKAIADFHLAGGKAVVVHG